MYRTMFAIALACLSPSWPIPQAGATPSANGIPADAQYACPMETHPDEPDPANRGPYFSAEPARCPRCGMELKPVNELEWVRLREAADGSEVAYTCPDHQHVFSTSGGECPRCGRGLTSFKVMYTCPNPEHASVISAIPGNCPLCGRGLAAYRGIWLDQEMADQNVPPNSGLAKAAAFHCPIHPLVHSDKPGACTICARPLVSANADAYADTVTIPPHAKYTCPMKTCRQFSDKPGDCPVCGMRLKPIDEVAWVKEMRDREPATDHRAYVCPMHPTQVQSNEPGNCSICGMQLVNAATFSWPKEAPEHVAAQVDYLTEHYLELESLLASDRTTDVARQALALVSASEELVKHVQDSGASDSDQLRSAADRLRGAALKMTGKDIEHDRLTFVALSAAMRDIIETVRPNQDRWPKLYIYHCPMSKGDWIQTTQEKRNPYYGFKMLNCGVLEDVK